MNNTSREFSYVEERFADIQLLRYRLDGFEQLSLEQKTYIYYLAEATLCGRDITFDQFGKYNILIRRVLEAIITAPHVCHDTPDFKALEVYLKRVWFSNGIQHHYCQEKLVHDYSKDYFTKTANLISYLNV